MRHLILLALQPSVETAVAPQPFPGVDRVMVYRRPNPRWPLPAGRWVLKGGLV
jgi:hypothetical protein